MTKLTTFNTPVVETRLSRASVIRISTELWCGGHRHERKRSRRKRVVRVSTCPVGEQNDVVPHVFGENQSYAIVTWTCQVAHDSTFRVFTRRCLECFDCNLTLHQVFEGLVELQFQARSGVKMTTEFSSAFSTHWQIHCVWCCV